MGTKIRPFNLHTSVDSHVKGLIDSDYIQARQTAGTDSSSTQAMIDSNFTNMDIDVHMPDDQKITFGNDSDFKIFHDGTRTVLHDEGTGEVQLRTSQFRIRNPGNTETLAKFVQDGAVELFHGMSGSAAEKKFETLDSGVNIIGNIAANIRSNPKGFSVTHTVDSSDNALLVGPINVDSGVTLTINGTLMVV